MNYIVKSFWLIITLFLFQSCTKKIISIKADKAVAKITDLVNFSYVGPEPSSIMWVFGDGTTSNEMNPKHRFGASGNYAIVCKAKFGKKVKESKMNIEIKHPEQCLVMLETKFGVMIIRLYDQTPQHRDNFMKLVEEGFYKDLLFHRVINGFMIQGGDPNSRSAGPDAQLGSGGPNYTIPAEFNKEFIHKKGALAAARTGDQVNPQKRSSGSQFYIVQGAPQVESGLTRVEDMKGFKYTEEQKKIYTTLGGTPFLDQDYTVFGEVVEGLDIIDKIASVKTAKADRPSEDVTMNIKILK